MAEQPNGHGPRWPATLEERQRLVRQAVREALREHKEAGRSVATWRNGQAVLVPPEEIVIPEEEPAVEAEERLPSAA
jgi:O-acetyl-ADP-ribose deacetylase (regulator of RNase III)